MPRATLQRVRSRRRDADSRTVARAVLLAHEGEVSSPDPSITAFASSSGLIRICGHGGVRCKSWLCSRCGPRLQVRKRSVIHAGLKDALRQGLQPCLLTLTVPDSGELEATWDHLDRGWRDFAHNLGRQVHGHVRAAGPFVHSDGTVNANLHVLVVPRPNLETSTLLDHWSVHTGASRSAQYIQPVRDPYQVSAYVSAQLWNSSPSAPERLLDAFQRSGDLDDLTAWHDFEAAAHGRRIVTASRSFTN